MWEEFNATSSSNPSVQQIFIKTGSHITMVVGRCSIFAGNKTPYLQIAQECVAFEKKFE